MTLMTHSWQCLCLKEDETSPLTFEICPSQEKLNVLCKKLQKYSRTATRVLYFCIKKREKGHSAHSNTRKVWRESFLQPQDDADTAAEQDDEDGAEAIDFLPDEGKEKEENADEIAPGIFRNRTEVLPVHQEQGSRKKQTYYSRPQATEDILHRRMVAILHEELADEQHQDEARQHDGKRGKEAAQDAPVRRIAGIDKGSVAHVCRTIDADGTGSTLADGDNIGELSHRHPMIMSNHLALYHRKHSITSTEAEKPDEEESPEELEKK